jgi:hypothetical protein
MTASLTDRDYLVEALQKGDRVSVTITGTVDTIRASDGVIAVRGDDGTYFYANPNGADTSVFVLDSKMKRDVARGRSAREAESQRHPSSCIRHRRRLRWIPAPGWWIHDDNLNGPSQSCSAMWSAKAPEGHPEPVLGDSSKEA